MGHCVHLPLLCVLCVRQALAMSGDLESAAEADITDFMKVGFFFPASQLPLLPCP